MRVLVIGGGISGLAAAFLAKAAGHDVVCVEPSAVPGGLVCSERTADGFLLEAGPQAVLDDAPDTTALIAAVGLGARVVAANAAARRRFVYLDGRLQPLPASPPALIRSRLLSPVGKLRLLAEPLVRRRRAPAGADGALDDAETIAAFGARRLGRQAGRLLATAVIGLYAADAAELSAASALPRLAALERAHGSLLRGVLAGRRRGPRRGSARPLSFPDGLGELPAALARALGDRLVRGRAAALAPRPGGGGGWRVAVEDGPTATLEGDLVVLAADAAASARLLAGVVPRASVALANAAALMTPVAICCLGFGAPPAGGVAPAIGMDLGGYGFLVARGERPKLLGCQYESSIFPGRAPEGGVLLRAILGGHGAGFDPEIVDRPDDAVADAALADLRLCAGLARNPDLVRVYRYPRGIPRYAPGHARRVAEVDAALAAAPAAGLHVIGHALRGVGVNESIRAAAALARALPAPASAPA